MLLDEFRLVVNGKNESLICEEMNSVGERGTRNTDEQKNMREIKEERNKMLRMVIYKILIDENTKNTLMIKSYTVSIRTRST